MASPTTPTHGKLGAIYRLRPNNFSGQGLNDCTLGTGFSGGGTSAYFTITIDATGTPDTFAWTKNGAGGASGVAITGAAQTLSDSQQVTFGATTGHTVGDKWIIGNFDLKPTTESGSSAQVTDGTARILNPNVTLTWADSNSNNLLTTNYTNATATFDGAVGTVTLSGNNGYIVRDCLEKVGYLVDWDFTPEVEFSNITAMGEKWEDQIAGLARATGGANGYFIGVDTFFDVVEDTADGTQQYHFLELYNYDPDQDQTGDRFNAWVNFTNLNVNAPIGEVVTEGINFKMAGIPSFTANT